MHPRAAELITSLALAPHPEGGYFREVMPLTKIEQKESGAKKSGTRLSPRELRRLADRMVASNDPAEVARLKKEMERGFYGDPADG